MSSPACSAPTLVLRPERETYLDKRHSHYVAEHIPNSTYVEISGEGELFGVGAEAIADEIQHFLTGVRRPVVSDRLLATVLFTDIVGSTERARSWAMPRGGRFCGATTSLVREEVRAPARAVCEVARGRRARRLRRSQPGDQQRDRHPRPDHDLDLEIRAGLHTGECELLPDDDIGGLAVHIGARVSGLAGPGRGARQQHRPRPHRRLGPDAHRPGRARAQGRPRTMADIRGRQLSPIR